MFVALSHASGYRVFRDLPEVAVRVRSIKYTFLVGFQL